MSSPFIAENSSLIKTRPTAVSRSRKKTHLLYIYKAWPTGKSSFEENWRVFQWTHFPCRRFIIWVK